MLAPREMLALRNAPREILAPMEILAPRVILAPRENACT
jgi:hypothetical protein